MPGKSFPARVIRTADEPPRDLNTIGEMAQSSRNSPREWSVQCSKTTHIYRKVKTGEMRCKSRTWRKKDETVQRKDNRNEAWEEKRRDLNDINLNETKVSFITGFLRRLRLSRIWISHVSYWKSQTCTKHFCLSLPSPEYTESATVSKNWILTFFAAAFWNLAQRFIPVSVGFETLMNHTPNILILRRCGSPISKDSREQNIGVRRSLTLQWPDSI
jgi:hypothetical protein